MEGNCCELESEGIGWIHLAPVLVKMIKNEDPFSSIEKMKLKCCRSKYNRPEIQL
jgi:hypothetical protein